MNLPDARCAPNAGAAAALHALWRVRTSRRDAAKVALMAACGEREAACHSARAAGQAQSEALAWAAGRSAVDPVLHAQTLNHLTRLDADARRTTQEVQHLQARVVSSRDRLRAHQRDCEVLERAWERVTAATRAQALRLDWGRADDSELRSRGEGGQP